MAEHVNSRDTFKTNNFDLIRLLAAAQVALYHGIHHLNLGAPYGALSQVLSYFPGVPVFFFVSGFLVSKSYESNPRLAGYFSNRALRIFPGLFICTMLAISGVWLTDYLSTKEFTYTELVVWLLGQVSVAQFYNPDFMREFGSGVLNGSLWTISVEIQFYLLVPLIYGFLLRGSPATKTLKLLVIIVPCVLLYLGYNGLELHFDSELWYKLLGVSFLPWIWMFLLGVVFQRNFLLLHRLLAARFGYMLPLYLVISYILSSEMGFSLNNAINPVSYFGLALLVFSFAYSKPAMSETLLHGNDISYGVYIYHMPVYNFFIYYGCIGQAGNVVLALVVTVLLAALSWFFIEKPCLQFKRHSLLATSASASGS